MSPRLAVARARITADVRSVMRESLLAGVVLAPPLLALLIRYGMPALEATALRRWDVALAPYAPLIMSMFVLLAPTMVGLVVGFLLLDERDDGVVNALLVAPLPFGGFLLYRCALPLALGFALTVACYPLARLTPLPPHALLGIAAVAALNGPVAALFLAAFAENRIAGFALLKVLNTLNMIPLGAWFVTGGWRWAAGVIPAFWPVAALWNAAAGRPYALLLATGALHASVVLLLLLRRLLRVLRR